MKKITDLQIKRYYKKIQNSWNKHLKDKGVKFQKLKRPNGEYYISGLILTYLYANMGKEISKKELTDFIRSFGIEANDVQQARHLSMQFGWNILSESRGDNGIIGKNTYKLVSITKPYCGFINIRRDTDKNFSWEFLKKKFNYRCATCGSKENQPNLKYKKIITKLQKGHIDPRKSISNSNIIPQCKSCNQAYKNNIIFDKRGRFHSFTDNYLSSLPEKEKRRIISFLQQSVV